MILSGKAQGNSSKVSVMGFSIAPICGRRSPAATPRSVRIHVVAGERMGQASIGQRLSGKELKKRQPSAIEGMCRPGKVDAPYTKSLFADLAPGGIGVRFQPLHPVPERARVMLSQRLAIDELESFGSESADDARHVRELPARKNVLLDKIADATAKALGAGPVVSDAVVQHQPTRFEDLMNLAEVPRIVLEPHVLEHADAGDLVVLLLHRQIEIVAQLDPYPPVQAERADLK